MYVEVGMGGGICTIESESKCESERRKGVRPGANITSKIAWMDMYVVPSSASVIRVGFSSVLCACVVLGV